MNTRFAARRLRGDERGTTTQGKGEARLRQALRRLAQAGRDGLSGLPARGPGAPLPTNDWERATDDRLAAIEKSLGSQNRLLLITVLSIVADALYSVLSGRLH